MFERFTKDARTCITKAQEQARDLRHSHIGPLHLLLGVMAEGKSIGFLSLRDQGLTLEELRNHVRVLSGPLRKEPMTGHIPFTADAKKILELAMREALELNHSWLGGEHLLLALIRWEDGETVQFLAPWTTQGDIRRAVMKWIVKMSDQPTEGPRNQEVDPLIVDASPKDLAIKTLQDSLILHDKLNEAKETVRLSHRKMHLKVLGREIELYVKKVKP